MHTYIQRQNQQANSRHIKITYLLAAPEPARGTKLVNFSKHLPSNITSGRCSVVKSYTQVYKFIRV